MPTSNGWRTAQDGFEAAGLSIVTQFHLAASPQHLFCFDGPGRGMCQIIKLAYQPVDHPSVQRTCPVPVVAHIQQPNLVIPHRIDSEVGLRLLVQIHAKEDGVIADLCLETIASLDHVVLQVKGKLEQGSLSDADTHSAGGAESDNKRRFIIPIATDGALGGALVADLGENGGISQREPEGDEWIFSFFDQPLEKGVILVGRLGVLRRNPEQSHEAFQTRCVSWLQSSTFL